MKRWSIGFVGAALSSVAVAQASPLSFAPYMGPATVNRDAFVVFSMVATNDGSTSLDYELISAPPGAGFNTDLESDRHYNRAWAAFFSWNTPSRAFVGSTNFFVVRAYDTSNPSITATGIVSITVVDIPPISSIQMSNGIPVLQLTNLLCDRSYVVEWSCSLPSTNWTPFFVFSQVNIRPPFITVFDTDPLQPRRFYRLSPSSDIYAYALP